MTRMAHTLRGLSMLLRYPDDTHLGLLSAVAEAIDREAALPLARRREISDFAAGMLRGDPIEVQARYVDLFDRGRSTSLHLFEHVHGDSRDRGPAMLDLIETYRRGGLELQGNELPDHLCVILEFASTQPAPVAKEFLAEMAHILKAVFAALRALGSRYASLAAAVLELAGQKVEAVPFTPDESLDDSWQEPEVFGGCSMHGQSAPARPQPVRFVRNAAGHEGAPA